MGKAFFITGTGTEIGKTIVTCSLAKQLLKEGKKSAFAIKPLISGWDNNIHNNDTLQILAALGLPALQENIEKISPWRFKAPLAANMAARRENIEINYTEVLNFCKESQSANEILLIEGAGGIMSPLTDFKTNLDLISDLDIPAILVCGTYLGAISHTLTAIKSMESMKAKIHATIVGESQNSIGLFETISELKNFTKHRIYGIEMVKNHNGFIWEKVQNLLDSIN